MIVTEALAKDFLLVFDGPAGKRVLDFLDGEAFVTKPLVMLGGGPIDPLCLAAHAGAQALVMDIHRIVKLAREPERPAEPSRAVSSTLEA